MNTEIWEGCRGTRTVTTMHVTCMQTALHVYENSCTLLIPLCKNNLNLNVFLFFCHVLGCLDQFVKLATSLRLLFCLFLFTEVDFITKP